MGGDLSFSWWGKYETFNSYSRVFDFGNGQNADNIIILNHGTSNGIIFDYYEGSTKYYSPSYPNLHSTSMLVN